MEVFRKIFTTIYLNILKVLIAILIIASLVHIIDLNKDAVIVGIVLLSFTGIEVYILRRNIKNKFKLLLILLCGFAISGLWLLNINSIPTSDFMTMYNCAQKFLNGDTSSFWGTSYIARFPHLTIMILYMAFMIKVFPINNILVMKLVNLALGTLTIYLIYLIVKEIFNSTKKALYAAALTTIFPPLVTYTGVFCTENIAIPLYLISTYIFLLVIKGKKNAYYLILSGIALSLGNLFRMVAAIMLIAYGMYIIIYPKDKLLHKIRNILLYAIPYILILFLVSSTLQALKITEFPLWKGSEPKITNILKGTNMESYGRWNEEDAAIVDKYNFDYEKIEEASKEIIKERLTTTPPLKLITFYIVKFALQWNEGDFGGNYWSKLYVPDEEIILDSTLGVFQIIYVVVLTLALLGIYNKQGKNHHEEINLFYIIFCGYGLMYLITESQGRYSYIISWVFIILAMEGISLLLNKINKDKKLENLNK